MTRFVPAAVFLVLAGLITHGHNAATGDPIHYMMAARSIAFDRDLSLANDYGDPANIIRIEPERHALPGRGDVLRPVHDVGLPVITAPLFGVAYLLADWSASLPESFRRRAKLDRFIALRQLVSLVMIGVMTWAAVLFMKAARVLGGYAAPMSWWVLAWALSPPMLTHGYVYFTEVPSAIVALICYMRRDDLVGERWKTRGAALGILTGLLVLVHVRNIGLSLALAGLAIWPVRRDLRRASGFAAGLVLAATLKIAQNFVFWGTFITTPHEHFAAWPGLLPALQEMTLRMGGLLFDGRHGLLLSAPVYLLAPAAFVALWRTSRRRAIELAVIIGAYLLFVLFPVTNIHGWRGGWSPAARFLVPIAPFLALPVAGFLARHRARWAVAPILAIQLAISAYLWSHPMLRWAEGAGPSPWLERMLGSPAAGLVPVWQQLDGTTSVTLVVCVAGLAVFTWMVMRFGKRDAGYTLSP